MPAPIDLQKPVITAGPYRGFIEPAYGDAQGLQSLAALPRLLRDAPNKLADGRNKIVTVRLSPHTPSVAVKSFGQQSRLKDLIDFRRGSKACRSWTVAAWLHQHGVGTPPPAGYLERWDGNRLLESYYLSEFQEGIRCFRDELNRLYREDPVCEKIMTLLQCAADAVWALHESGVVHYDLGNQNILLRRLDGGRWGDVQFVDLNRARIKPALSLQDRARDLSRIDLPSDFLRVFKVMYFRQQHPPAEFEKWERRFRTRFALHTWSRCFRHPFRTRRRRLEEKKNPLAPRGRDLWIWDERSAQAVSTLRRKDRKRLYPASNAIQMAAAAPALWPIARNYRQRCQNSYQAQVTLINRIGMTIEPSPLRLEEELRLLKGLGINPVFLRFYHHQTPEQWKFSIDVAKRLRADGHSVSIALVQDRKAVLEPARWARFVGQILEALKNDVEWVEVGHAINRVKWGLWSLDEYLRLLEPAAEAAARHPHLHFMGPAAIDFEYHYLVGLLNRMPSGFRFDALSHLLYVDRRGAPENRQGRFGAEEKFALARAIAEWAPSCEPRLIVTETNWPLLGAGVYSPVGAPYEVPGPRFNDPSVTEDDYADYMIRYLAIALCSGMVERVYWWRLVARGFGLVDDAHPDAWRIRPAYPMLQTFVALLGDSRFESRIACPKGQYLLRFRRPDNSAWALAWSAAGTMPWRPAIQFDGCLDAFGNEIPIPHELTGRPVYLKNIR
ncbi:MAG TPA: hypothetical protein DCZ95_03885 [Verrucomicrobia bacterium]|nr:hypothetical protein [Verrucomicrobiota bacterium]